MSGHAGSTGERDGWSDFVRGAYHQDPQFPAALNGRFHGIVVDRTRGTTTLFNDRYGMERIYYHESREALYPTFRRRPRPFWRSARNRVASMAEAWANGWPAACVAENRTLFERVNVLPAGAAWSFRGGGIESKRGYFDPSEWENQAPLDPESYFEELRSVFARSLPRYFESPQPIGMSLTGGLDTRMIMAWHKPAPRSLPCYTFGGMFRDCRDVQIARMVAREAKQSHEVITVGQDFLAGFPDYAERTVCLSDGART